MKQPVIVIIGHICIDRNKTEHDQYTGWGSPALYMATYFQGSLGITPRVITTYADDFLPYAAGFRLYPSRPNASRTLTYENIVAGHARTQFCHYAKEAGLPQVDGDVVSALQKADIVFLAPLTPGYSASYAQELMAYARPGSYRFLLPQGYFRAIGRNGLVSPRAFSESSRILPLFDVVILSDEDHPQALEMARMWHGQSPHTEIVVTQNAQGATIIGNEGEVRVPTVPVPEALIIDSIGCGDVFSAATAYGLYRTQQLAAAVQDGHAAAGKRLVTQGFGKRA